MNSTTIGTVLEARPTGDTPSRATALTSTAERRARTLSPTVYCPSLEIEECIERSQGGGLS